MRSAFTRASGPPLQSSAASSGRAPSRRVWAVWVAANQPAHSRIIRFVFPLPEEPTITECRINAGAGKVWTGRQRCRTTRIVAPVTICPRRFSRGTAPGAVTRPSAARA